MPAPSQKKRRGEFVRKLIILVAALSMLGCRPPYEARIRHLCGLPRAVVSNEPFIAHGLAGNVGVYASLRSCRNHTFRLVYSGDKFDLPMSFMRSIDEDRGKFTAGLISGSFRENESHELYFDVLSVDPIKIMDLDERSWDTIATASDRQFMRLVIKGET
jgi:hypothetical protein